MISLRRVLVPMDFSEDSEDALRYGRAMAFAFGSELHLLHVVQDPYTQPWAAEAFPSPLDDVLAEWEKEARRRLEAAIPPGERDGVLVAVQVGSPFLEIVRYAADHAVDLIVIGTHGRGPIGHMLLGSVADRVLRKAPCPVLTVRHAARTRPAEG